MNSPFMSDKERLRHALAAIIAARPAYTFACCNCGHIYSERAVRDCHDCPDCGRNVIPRA